MSASADDSETTVVTLGNGVRVLVIRLPHVQSVSVSVFVRTGSRHESARLNGISHLVEHMAFKGTHTRSCQQINLDAERLGADVNAHTDKDHTAYHMSGRAQDAERFVAMLGDIVQGSTFPGEELERERAVILQEMLEEDEDDIALAFKLFDETVYGSHPLAQPVIGSRRNVQRITRDDLIGYVGSQYTGANVVVGVIGNVAPAAMVAAAEAAFAAMPAGGENAVAPAPYVGGIAARRQPGSGQTHVVLGFPIPDLLDERHHAALVAAALFGEGMSSPFLDEIRERRGLVYYASCSADVTDLSGQFVIEASMAPDKSDEFFGEVARLLAAQAHGIQAVDLERARNQLAVRRLRAQERPSRRLEDAALDLFVFGRVRDGAELLARSEAVTAEDVRISFEQMLAAKASIALAGKIGKGATDRLRGLFAAARAG